MQFQLEQESLPGLAACARLKLLDVGWPAREGLGKLRRQLPGLVVA